MIPTRVHEGALSSSTEKIAIQKLHEILLKDESFRFHGMGSFSACGLCAP